MSDQNNQQDSQKEREEFYRQSVFLPKTDFPMRGGLPQKEPEIIAQWKNQDLYKQLRDRAKGKEKFILHDGPPYANGDIHMGHALNKVLKDVVIRSYSMMGYDAPYVPGWDCHGLPIEWKIEEKYRNQGEDKDNVPILQFRDECRKFAREWVDTQAGQFERLGVQGDWENPYLTMTNRAEGKIVREIHKFVKNEGLYKGAKPVMWSVVEKTALAEAEVEYKEHKSVTIWVRFPVVQSPVDILQGADIVIWTTTPWTIPSNRALAFGSDIEYGVYQVKSAGEEARAEVGAKLALATALADDIKAKAQIEEWELLGTFKGSQIGESYCHHPLHERGFDYFRNPQLLEGDFVTDDAGTGFVHIAGGHGEDDFNLIMAHNRAADADNQIEITDNVTDDGIFRPHVPLFAGLEVYTQEGKLGGGNFAVLKELQDCGKLLAKGSIKHEYPHSWRSKAPLIFRTTPQWFIAMDGSGQIRKKALSEITETSWVPSKGEARIRSMIENRPDWCISRQRAWGVPIALFLNKETGAVLDDEDVLNRIGSIFEEEGADAWWSRDPKDFLGNSYNSDDYTQVFDIVDVWFESGSTHAFVCEDREELRRPEGKKTANLYLEGSDQHRGWFHSSLLESVGTRGVAPYEAVLTHGFVLDDKGYKMSKSLGNVVDPLKLMDQYGADILRLWALTSDYSEDIRIGQNTLKNTADLYRRIRNTLRFVLGALEGFTPAERLSADEYAKIPELEQLMLHQLHEMDQKLRGYIRDYDFMKLTKTLHDFCNEELSSFYFDIRKDRLYCDRPDSRERRATRTVMAHVFECLSAWLAPVLCFTAEEAWSHRPQAAFGDDQSIHLREFPSIPQDWQNTALADKWLMIRNLRNKIVASLEPYRADKTIGSSLEAAPVVTLDPAHAAAIEGLDLAEIAIVSSVELKTGDAVGVEFKKAEGKKCLRCWKILPEVGSDPEYPDLSPRDADAVRWYMAQEKAA